jgi:hypothetical protein
MLLFSSATYAANAANKSTNLQAIVLTIITVVLPVTVNYIVKIFENRNASNRVTTEIDIHQKRIDFLNNYYNIQKNYISADEDTLMKAEIKAQLSEIKNEMDSIVSAVEKVRKPAPGTLTVYQSVFLLFPAKTFGGWLWKMLYYANFVILLLIFFTLFEDDNYKISLSALTNNLCDSGTYMLVILFIVVQIIFHQLALRSYHRYIKKLLTATPTP